MDIDDETWFFFFNFLTFIYIETLMKNFLFAFVSKARFVSLCKKPKFLPVDF
jgi:hypothetical protein